MKIFKDNYTKHLLLILYSFLLLPVWSAGIEQDDRYKFRSVSPFEIIGAEGVKSICQDKQGFMWVITPEEVFRFDGIDAKMYSKKIYGYGRKQPLIQFRQIFKDSSNDLYLGTSAGVFKFNELFDGFFLLNPIAVEQIEEDVSGKLWFVGPEIYYYDRKEHKLTNFSHYDRRTYLDNNNVACTDKLGNVFLGTDYGKISAVMGKTHQIKFIYSFPKHTKLISLYAMNDQLWVLTETKGLYVIDIVRCKVIKVYDFFLQKDNNIIPSKSFFVDQRQQVWIGTQQGLYFLNPKTDEKLCFFQNKGSYFGIISNSIWTIADDYQGNLWFGTSEGISYLSNYDRNRFHTISLADYAYVQKPTTSFAKRNDALWFGTEGGGLFCYKENQNIITSYHHETNKNSLRYNNVKTLLLTNNYLWIGMYKGGIDRLDLTTGQFRNYNEKDADKRIVSNDVTKILPEQTQGMWIIYQSISSIITFFSFKDNSSQHFLYENARDSIWEDARFLDMCRDDKEGLWLITTNSILKFDTKSRRYRVMVKPQEKVKSDQPFSLKSIFYDHVSRALWIGTKNKGLLKYDIAADKITVYDSILKFGHITINSIIGDNNGNIWMGSEIGLFKFQINKCEFYHFDKNDGVLSSIHSSRSVFSDQRDSVIYFGGKDGFTYFNPQDVAFNETKPKILISDFIVNNQSVYDDSVLLDGLSRNDFKKITLNYNQNNVGIKLSCTNYLMPMKNRYRYRLKNYENDWIEVDASQRYVYYPKLPRGYYVFEAMASNNDGVWGDPFMIELTVYPAPWRSWWACWIYFILLSTVIYFLYKEKCRRDNLKNEVYLASCRRHDQEENHQAQLRFFTNITHEFKTPLTVILGTLEHVEDEKYAIPKFYLNSLKANSKRLYKLVNQVIDFRSVENGILRLKLEKTNFNRLITNVTFGIREYAFDKNLTLKVLTDPQLSKEMSLDVNVIEEIVINLLDNALKYTPNGGLVIIKTLRDINSYKSRFKVSYTEQNPNNCCQDYFGFVVRDTGVGISEESISKIFNRFYQVEENDYNQHLGSGIGLALVKSLVLFLRGFITVASERGTGTDIIVGLPLINRSLPIENDVEWEKDFEIVVETKDDETSEDVFELKTASKCYSILYVEDNEEIKRLVLSFLSDIFDVSIVSNGEEALELLKGKSFDLILSDWMMPRMDGVTLCRKVKGNPAFSHIPFVLMTVRSGIENQLDGFGAGAEAFLEKPINSKLLLTTIHNLLKLKDNFRSHFKDNYFIDISDSTLNKIDRDLLDKFIDIVLRRIEEEEVDLDEMAMEMGMSRRKLFSFIKDNTGKSIVEFVRSCRVRMAARMMVEDRLSSKEAMMRVGIESQSYFIKIFKKEFDETPTAFVAKMRNKSNS